MPDHSAHPDHHTHAHDDDGGLAEVLDLDAEVLAGVLDTATGWVEELAGARPPERLLDLGCGTGTGTAALLRRFPEASVLALDVDDAMLRRVEERARTLGVADRVRTRRVDLDAAWPALDALDLVWAATSLHHLADPDEALGQVRGVLRPGGRLVLVELSSWPRFLPDDLGVGRPGLEARLHALLAGTHAEEVPALGSAWGARLSSAGFDVEVERTVDVDLTSLPPVGVRYAEASLRRLRHGLADRLAEDDRVALDALLDAEGPHALRHRDDLGVRTERSVWIAAHPA